MVHTLLQPDRHQTQEKQRQKELVFIVPVHSVFLVMAGRLPLWPHSVGARRPIYQPGNWLSTVLWVLHPATACTLQFYEQYKCLIYNHRVDSSPYTPYSGGPRYHLWTRAGYPDCGLQWFSSTLAGKHWDRAFTDSWLTSVAIFPFYNTKSSTHFLSYHAGPYCVIQLCCQYITNSLYFNRCYTDYAVK